MMKKNNTGFLYYAHNNERINYLKLAICSALTGHYQLKNFKATIVTDDYSLEYLSKENKKILENLFENIKIDNRVFKTKYRNYRTVMNVFENKGTYPWHNRTRPNAYIDSPYDETILIDVDFIFQDNNLEKLWSSNTPIMMNKKIIPIINSNHAKRSNFFIEESLSKFTIPLYWATLVYFNRSKFSETFFELIDNIHNNYLYYQKLYDFDKTMYRNDFSFSIALHMMNGFKIDTISNFEIPYKFILTSTMDDVYRIDKCSTKFIIYTRDWKAPWNIINIKNISYHCLNKVSLGMKFEQFLSSYAGVLNEK